MAVTLRDVAAHAGVSAITVSRALNNSGYVSQDVRARVITSATELGYVQNAVASSLRANKTQLIALLAGVTNPFWSNVARGIEDTAMEAGYGLIMCDTADEPAKEARYIDLLTRRRIDGLIIAATQDSAPILQNLKKRRQPFVLIDRVVEGVAADSVRGDNFGAAYQMTRHLISTGYTRIGMVSGAHNVSTAEERVEGYRSALAESGMETEDTILYGQYSEIWGYQATKELMLRENPPEALFAANNFIALGILECLHTLGLRVPEDVAIVCFDDTTKVESARLLTTASQPAEEMGRAATHLLLQLIDNPDKAPEEIVLPIDLMIRNSCGCGTTNKPVNRSRRESLQTAS
ncbi:MAG: LacI family DNA-binding transcriptional regulator [Chloroflexia bacterium]